MVEKFWSEFLKNTGRDASTTYLECFYFDLNEQSANALLELVLSGRKRATASSLHYFEKSGVKLPEPGDLSIVTDWSGTPRCVIETTDVQTLPFQDVMFELCKWEGEDDCLESWQTGHRRFFTEEGNQVGYQFSEVMPVVFEKFICIYII